MKSHYHTDNEWKIVAEQALSLLKQLIAIKSYSGQRGNRISFRKSSSVQWI